MTAFLYQRSWMDTRAPPRWGPPFHVNRGRPPEWRRSVRGEPQSPFCPPCRTETLPKWADGQLSTPPMSASDPRRHTEDLRRSEERFRLLVEGVADYGIFMLDPE